jgi:ATP-dependent DNA helicase RecQ
VHEALLAAGESVGLYHGKLAAAERHAAQEAFMGGERRVMVATNAFGLGIDKPDIRFVLHYQLPAGLEAYYQEAGRAGRDGRPARCTLLYLRGDKAVQQFFLAGRYPGDDDAAPCAGLAGEAAARRQRRLDAAAAAQARLQRPRSKVQVALGLLRKDRRSCGRSDGSLRLLRQPGRAARACA